MKEKQELKLYMRKLGMAEEWAEVYLDLVEHGESTPLLVARSTGLNRTKVYRVLEQMQKQRLVSEIVGEHTTRFVPAGPERIEEMLKAKQVMVAEVSSKWGLMGQKLEELEVAREAETKVRYYKGRSGIQQMVWNTLKASKEIVGYTHTAFEGAVGEKFAQDYYDEFYRRNLHMRDLVSESYRESMRGVELAKQSYRQHPHWESHIQSRYLAPQILVIPHQMDIYDGVVSFYRWEGKEVFGVEIYNPHVYQMQKQLFELAWEKGKAT